MKITDFASLIVFENQDFILINKPYDISSLDERDVTRPSILKMVKEYHADAQLCHRLDKETSGILAIAKHPEAYRHLSLQFQKRTLTKIYHAVCQGLHELENYKVDLPIAIAGKAAVRIDKKEGKRSETFVSTLQLFKGHSLLEARPRTGRMHQIRIHLAAIRAHIVADTTYGGKMLMLSDIKKKYRLGKFQEEEQPFIKRVALHAFALHFKGMDGEELEIEAPYPKDFRALVMQLEKNT